VVDHDLSMGTNKQHRTDLLHLVEFLKPLQPGAIHGRIRPE